MRRSRNLPLPAGRLDYIIFASGISGIKRSADSTKTDTKSV